MFTGPLNECFQSALADITDYTGRQWLIVNSTTDVNNPDGPKLTLVFQKENE